MLKRKITTKLKQWKETPRHKPLVIKGCRQCGKSFSAEYFAKSNYENVVLIDFYKNPSLASAFESSLEVDEIILYLTALLGPRVNFVPYKTCIILDEIQACPKARTSLKFFAQDGRYDVIATGSLLGISNYNEQEDPAPIPVGSTTELRMFPLDFEEFLWANGINEEIIQRLNKYLIEKKPVPEVLHNKMRELHFRYVAIGGMPEVVNSYLEDKMMNKVLGIQRDIVNGYRDDMLKYAPKSMKSNIRECFDSIPRQLNQEYKKFRYSLVKKSGRSVQYLGCIQWIEDAAIITRCYNVTLPELPFYGNSLPDEFKVYMADIGLLIAMLDDGTQSDILRGSLYGYKGAIFENLMADAILKAGKECYYFHKDSGLEIDFLIKIKDDGVLVECKSKTGNAKSIKTVLGNPDKYHIHRAIKFGDYNIGEMDSMLTLPFYMTFLVLCDGHEAPDITPNNSIKSKSKDKEKPNDNN